MKKDNLVVILATSVLVAMLIRNIYLTSQNTKQILEFNKVLSNHRSVIMAIIKDDRNMLNQILAMEKSTPPTPKGD